MRQPKFAVVEFIFLLPEVLKGKKRERERTRVRKKNSKRKMQ